MGLFSKSTEWSEEECRQARHNMVERQLAGRDVTDPAVLEAMRKVPRHLFIPADLRREAYDDSPLPIGYGQTISQPYVVGSMTQLLGPDKSKSVFEIGTGSGYQTAILAELFGPVVTVEYYSELSKQAQKILQELGYNNIAFHVGDGLKVPEKRDKFDAIIITAAPEDIPDELVSQLKEGGRLIVPVGTVIQYLELVIKDKDGKLDFQTLYPVRFVPLQR